MVLEGALADRERWRADRCPMVAALGVVGTRSALVIMREALYGTTRFDDFVERVGVTEAVAAQRLRELTEHGLLRREPYREPGRRTRYEYRLTEMGRDFAPVMLALYEWGAKYASAAERPPLAFHHRDCGAEVAAEIVCDEGHRLVAGDITVRAVRRGDSGGH
jgi:DNA-binding HxlR family transcriptional regulator